MSATNTDPLSDPTFRATLKRLVAAGEHAKALLDLGGSADLGASAKNGVEKGAPLILNGKGLDHVLPTVKRNCDAAYEILQEAKRPLQRDEILERMRSLGKTSLTKGTSLAFYLRQDKKRFKTAGKGLWKAI